MPASAKSSNSRASAICLQPMKCGDLDLTKLKKSAGRRHLSTSEKIKRAIYFGIFYFICLVVVYIFNSEWITVPILCVVIGAGIGELNGISIFNFFPRDQDKEN